MKRNHLFLITNQFPYGIGESFLENEVGFLTKSFDTVIVLSKDITSNNIRYQKSNFFPYRISTQSGFGEILLSPVLFLTHFPKAAKIILAEISNLKDRNKKISFFIIQKLIHDLFKALVLSRHIKKIIQKHELEGRITFYSYWLNSSALATILLESEKWEIKRIARAHRVDLYEEDHPDKYLTFRSVLVQHLDKLFTISTHGSQYLKSLVGHELHHKIQISRLGTLSQELNKTDRKQGELLIVSCSFLREVKRVHLIIEALAYIDIPIIHWTHFGDGPLKETLEHLASKKLSAKRNIKYTFYGEVQNQDLLEFYRKNFITLFLNSSSSEGIPVTIMEAQSFGIPVIAPDVGGITEIVSESNGRIFPKDARPDHIASLISEILTLPSPQYQELRTNAYNTWRTRYNADLNFSTFVAELQRL